MEDLRRQFKGVKFFTTLDLRNGYNNIRIKKGHEWKGAFRTPTGVYEPTVMFFGMKNSPAHFQRYMDTIFAKIDNKKKKVQSRTRSAPNKTKAQTKSKSKKKKKNNHTSTRKRSKPTKTSGGGANNSDDSFDSGDNNESDSDGSNGSDEDDSNSEPWFAIKDIIGEKKLKKGKVYYLVQWEGIDPDTGEAYEPTWVCLPEPIILYD